MEIESDDIAGKHVAHFAGSGPRHNQKQKFVKKGKSARDVDQAFASIQGNSDSPSVVCFECGGLGDYKRDRLNLVGLKSQKTSGGNGNKTGGRPASRNISLRRLGLSSEQTIIRFIQLTSELSSQSCTRALSHNHIYHRLQLGATELILTTTK